MIIIIIANLIGIPAPVFCLLCGHSFALSLGVMILCGKRFINFASKFDLFAQHINKFMSNSHKAKYGIPNAGGVLMLIVLLVCFGLSFFYSIDDKSINLPIVRKYLGVILLSVSLFSLAGFIDDFVKSKNKVGVRPRIKLLMQILCGILTFVLFKVCACMYYTTAIIIPFYGLYETSELVYFLLFVLTFVAVTNAVNLTDGLDGLAASTAISSLLYFIINGVVFFTHYKIFSSVSYNIHMKLASIAFASCFIGILVGFLKFNLRNAKVFMGDCGSLLIGAAVTIMATVWKQQLFLPLICLIPFCETVSVILQVASYKIYKKRIFLMAPVHHHFERLGWSDLKILVVFNIMNILGIMLALVILLLSGNWESFFQTLVA
jgi:phospho-N-acetylmuramoyl-pentapeptide-transferase